MWVKHFILRLNEFVCNFIMWIICCFDVYLIVRKPICGNRMPGLQNLMLQLFRESHIYWMNITLVSCWQLPLYLSPVLHIFLSPWLLSVCTLFFILLQRKPPEDVVYFSCHWFAESCLSCMLQDICQKTEIYYIKPFTYLCLATLAFGIVDLYYVN